MNTSPALPLNELPSRELLAPLARIVRQYADVRSEAEYENVIMMAIDSVARLARTLPLEWVRSELGPLLDRVVANPHILVHDRIVAAGLSIWCHWNTKGAVDYLGSCLADKDHTWRMSAVDVLGQCTHDAVPYIPAMIELLTSDHEPERLAVVKAFERMGPHAVSAAPALIARFGVEKSGKVRAAILEAAGTIGAGRFAGLEEVIKPVITLADVAAAFGRNPPGKGIGVALLRRFDSAPQARVHELLGLVRGGERDERFVEPAAQFLFNLGVEAAPDIVAALRKEEDNTAKVVLILAVGKHAAAGNTAVDETLPLLISELNHDMFGCMSEVCWAADSAVDAFGIRAVPELKQAALGDGERQLQALDKLARMRRTAIEANKTK